MASNFPKLPGYVVTHDPTIVNHAKVSHVKLDQIRNGQNQEVPLYAVPKPASDACFRPEKTEASKSLSQTQYGNHLGGNMSEQFEPTFVKLDKQVLRFTAFFKESVAESRLENMRVHKLTLFYYLEDKSIMIIEPKQVNSGIPQGGFLKRQMVLRPDGMTPFMPQDFSVGSDVQIYGRALRITDCDEYTRQFYQNLGQPQAAAIEVPTDAFLDSKVPVARPRENDLKEFMEKSLGGGKVASQKQFLDNDRKVLRFFAFADGDLPYVLHYYLADDTIEIREVHHPNDGRDSFPLMLRRQKLPFSHEVKQPGLSFIGDNYLTCDEIMPDQPIVAFGRAFTVSGVDEFTQRFFGEKYGRHFELSGIQAPEPRPAVERQIPPYNGFGSEEDTLGYIYDLVPKKPKGDFFKSVDNDKRVLRYTARFNTRVPEDLDRRFIISFYLGNDTISIYEPPVKNSGIIPGPVLRRAQYKNVDRANALITPSDLPIGGDIKINGFSYHIESCDDYTSNYLREHFC